MPPRVSVISHCKPAEKSTFKRLVIAHANANAKAKAKANANALVQSERLLPIPIAGPRRARAYRGPS